MSTSARTAGLPFVLAMTVLVQMFIALAMAAPAVLASPAASDLGVAPETLGLFMLVSGLASMLCSPFIGEAIHHLGAFRVNQLGVLLVALSLFAAATGNLVMVLLCALLLGAGQTSAMPSAAQLLAKVTPPHRMSLVLSIRQSGVPIGSALAGLIIPALLLLMDWRSAVLVLAVLLLLAVLAEAPCRGLIDDVRAAGPVGPSAGLPALLRVLRAQPALRALALCALGYTFAQSVLVVYIVSYLHLELGYSLAAAGAAFALSQAGALVARLFWGWLADRIGSAFQMLAWMGVAGAALCIVAAMFSPAWPLWAVSVTVTLMGATLTGWNGVYAGSVVRHAAPGAVGATIGATNFFGYIGMLSGPPLCAGAVALTGSYASAYFLAALACLPVAWQLGVAGRGAQASPAPPGTARSRTQLP